MKYFIVIIWSVVLGMVLGFITSSLEGYGFNILQTIIVSIVVGLTASILITSISKEKSKN